MQNTVWGNRHKDWFIIQEGQSIDGYRFVLEYLAPNNGVRLLDIGCGTGFFCRMASDRGAAVTGIDATPAFIEDAKLRLPTASFLMGDMEDLPFDDSCFDIVCGFNSFQYAGNLEKALEEAKRVLTEHGRLAILIWGKKEDCECVTLLNAIAELLPASPAGEHAGPFSLSDTQMLKQTLLKVGFNRINFTEIPSTWDYPDTETAIKGLMSLGAVSKAIENAGIHKVKNVISKAIQSHLQDNSRIIFYNKYRIVTAEK